MQAILELPAQRLRPLQCLLLGGIVAGTLDILYAFAFWGAKGVSPIRILHVIAGGLLGQPAAMQGGIATALLGAVAHCGIATGMVVAYYLVSRRVRELLARPLFFGSFYGVFLYFFMQHVVLPLSAVPGNPGSPPPLVFWSGIAVHAFFVGVPAAWFARAAHRAGGTLP